jgi:hypothetical protein
MHDPTGSPWFAWSAKGDVSLRNAEKADQLLNFLVKGLNLALRVAFFIKLTPKSRVKYMKLAEATHAVDFTIE